MQRYYQNTNSDWKDLPDNDSVYDLSSLTSYAKAFTKTFKAKSYLLRKFKTLTKKEAFLMLL